MDISLESALSPDGSVADRNGKMAGRPLEQWNSAYGKVESYFQALRVRNKALLGRLVIDVLKRAMRRAPLEPSRSATELAVEEMDHLVTVWFAEILQENPAGTDQMLSTRGRLALLLADMPGKWQDQFLQPGPWPAEFVNAMRETYLRSGPDFQLSQMSPRPMHFGPITTLTYFSRLPYVKMGLAWLCFALVLLTIFLATHRH